MLAIIERKYLSHLPEHSSEIWNIILRDITTYDIFTLPGDPFPTH